MKFQNYRLSLFALLVPIFLLLEACNDKVRLDNYLPAPANRTSPPAIESAELVDKKLVVRWNSVAGAEKYRLYYGTGSGVSPAANDGMLEVRGESATVDGIKEYTDYYFTATSFNSRGLESEPSAEFKYTAPLPPPPPPVGGAPGTPVGDCTKTHTLAGHTPVWTYSQCAPVSGIKIDQGTVGADGSALGGRSINVGRVSFSVTGASNAQYVPAYTLVFLVMMKAHGHGGREANWHWLSFGTGGPLEFRLVMQRFDGVCPNFCEGSQQEMGITFENPAEPWTWDCAWNTSEVTCDVYRNGGYFTTLRVNSMGPYFTLDYLGIGDQTTPGYAGLAGAFSNIRLTIFQ